jgi:oligopeptide transport system permease protein
MMRWLSKIVASALTLVVLACLCFALLHAAPGGPFDTERDVAPGVQAALNARYHLDQPFLTQLWNYLSHAVRGDLGPSFQYTDFSVSELLARALPISLMLGGSGLLLAMLLTLLLGLAQSHRVYGVWMRAFGSLLLALPKYVTAPILVLLFAITWHLFPAAGLNPPLWKSLFLPALALAIPQAAMGARLLSGAIQDAEKSDALRAARARGLSSQRLLWRHTLPIALPQALAFLAPAAIALLSGSAVIEQVFSLPGLGRYLVQGALNRDYTLVLGVVLTVSLIVMCIGLVADAVLAWADPRVR